MLEAARLQDAKHGSRWSSRAAVYCAAVLTGLRRNELRQLIWDDVDFDQGLIRVRAEVGKARRADVIPLHPDVAETLRAIRNPEAKPLDRVFKTMPTAKTFNFDLRRAGIPKRDEADRVVDLHALRTTLGTELARQGIAPQLAQKIMRHSDYRITMEHSVSLGLAETAAALQKLPGVTNTSGTEDKEAAQGIGEVPPPTSRNPSTPQQNPQHTQHDTVLKGASACDEACDQDLSTDDPKSLQNAMLSDSLLVAAKAEDGMPGRT